MRFRRLERQTIVASRFLALIAVVGSLAGSVLMFGLGAVNIFMAFRYGLMTPAEGGATLGTRAVINVIEGLDRFLIAIVLLYFTYGVYSLFIHPEESEENLALPAWLRIGQIGQLKQVVAELILIILFVLFLRQALEAFSTDTGGITWLTLASLLVLPLSALMLAVALRLAELHPKRREADDPMLSKKTGKEDGERTESG